MSFSVKFYYKNAAFKFFDLPENDILHSTEEIRAAFPRGCPYFSSLNFAAPVILGRNLPPFYHKLTEYSESFVDLIKLSGYNIM